MASKIHFKRKKRSVALQKLDIHIGHPFFREKYDAVHMGLLLAAENFLVLIGVVLLSAIMAPYAPVWLYALLVSPFLYLVLWAWFTQSALHQYQTTALHEALLTAKISVFPFMLFMVIMAITAAAGLAVDVISFAAVTVFFNAAVGGLAIMLLGLTCIVFGLRHHVRIEL